MKNLLEYLVRKGNDNTTPLHELAMKFIAEESSGGVRVIRPATDPRVGCAAADGLAVPAVPPREELGLLGFFGEVEVRDLPESAAHLPPAILFLAPGDPCSLFCPFSRCSEGRARRISAPTGLREAWYRHPTHNYRIMYRLRSPKASTAKRRPTYQQVSSVAG